MHKHHPIYYQKLPMTIMIREILLLETQQQKTRNCKIKDSLHS